MLLVTACGSGPGEEEAPPPVDPQRAAAGAPPQLRGYYTQRLQWSDCGEDYQCAQLRVPLNYERPGDGDIELAVTRRPAGRRDRRIGSLVMNPGGPGGSGVEYARAADGQLTDGLRERFDQVGFDPRGVVNSSPMDCVDDRELDAYLSLDNSPDTPAEEQTFEGATRRFVAGCKARSAKVLPYLSTRVGARDMDVLRAVLGDEQLYYLGKSYGALLGTRYAEQFPRRVGRMVLDGVLDPNRSAIQNTREQAAGFTLELREFVADCARQPDCPLGRDPEGGIRRIEDLLASLDRTPMATGQDRVLSQALGVLGLITPLYDRTSWRSMRAALAEAFRGNGGPLLAFADASTQRQPGGRYSGNRNEVIYAVNCLDWQDVKSARQVKQLTPSMRRASPQFGVAFSWGSLICAHWPAGPPEKPREVRAPGTQPILVIGTLHDPATPYPWAQSLAAQLDSGVLLTFDSGGHTAYQSGSDCIDAAVDRYLLDGQPPPEGTRCG
jgi:pimeloyl-ACP methyl ester carboxylesterase